VMFFKRALARQSVAMNVPDIAKTASPLTLSALRRLIAYSWPCNVRELENVAERLAVHATMGGRAEPIDAAALANLVPEMALAGGRQFPMTMNLQAGAPGDATSPPLGLKTRSRADERLMIERALVDAGGDRDAVCRQLGISRTTLWRKLREVD
jgi:propionate catabolism operon transcriptional regulator